MKRSVSIAASAALALAGALLAVLVASSPAEAWDVEHLPSGYSTAHWINTSPPPGTCREGYNVQGYYASISVGLCDPAFQQKLDDFINSTCPSSVCPPPTTAAATTALPPTTTAPVTTAPAPAPAPPTVTQTVVATLPAPPYADFDAATTNPDVVAFTDASSGLVASRVWQFGDGTAGTGSPATHVYAGPGVYYVTMIVIDSNGLAALCVHQLTIAADHSIALGPRQTQAVATAKTSVKPKAKPAVKKKAKKTRPPRRRP